MIRGTTPTHTFWLPFDTARVRTLRITYVQRGEVVLTKTEQDCTLEGYSVCLRLSQVETLAFTAGDRVQLQIRVLTEEGDVFASRVLGATVEDALCEEVLS